MIWEELSINQCIEIVESWNNQPYSQTDGEYEMLKRELSREYGNLIDKGYKGYGLDLKFGIYLYELLNSKYKFDLRKASNDGLWRHMAVKVIPGLICERYGGVKHDHLYKKAVRIWPKTLWWYIYLSWQGDSKSTYEVLKNNTTDEILNLVERPGQSGYRIDLSRKIMKKYYSLSIDEKKRNRNIFRKVVKLNNALTMTLEPALFSGGLDGYVDYLFNLVLKESRAIK